MPGSTQEQRVIFETQVDELLRAADGTINAIDRIEAELVAVKETLHRSQVDGSVFEIADSIQERILTQRDRLSSNMSREIFKEWDDVTLQERLWHARFDADSGAYGPTASQRNSFAIGRRLYDDVAEQLTNLVDVEYAALKEALDASGVPWTPGRGVQ